PVGACPATGAPERGRVWVIKPVDPARLGPYAPSARTRWRVRVRRLAWIAAVLSACTYTSLTAGCRDGGSSGSTGTNHTATGADTVTGADPAAVEDALLADTVAPGDTTEPVQDEVRVVTLLDD